jgi:thiamine transport system ATP-binding protein
MLDEPLGSLDRALRDRLLPELRALLDEQGITALYVTHDHEEALSLADRLVLLDEGRVMQAGTPAELWARPAGEWVARFLGFTNLLEVEVVDGQARAPWGAFPLPAEEAARRGPHLIVLPAGAFKKGDRGRAHLRGTVTGRSFRGSHYLLNVRVGKGLDVQAELGLEEAPAPGEEVALLVEPRAVVVLEPEPGSPLAQEGDLGETSAKTPALSGDEACQPEAPGGERLL